MKQLTGELDEIVYNVGGRCLLAKGEVNEEYYNLSLELFKAAKDGEISFEEFQSHMSELGYEVSEALPQPEGGEEPNSVEEKKHQEQSGKKAKKKFKEAVKEEVEQQVEEPAEEPAPQQVEQKLEEPVKEPVKEVNLKAEVHPHSSTGAKFSFMLGNKDPKVRKYLKGKGVRY